MHKNSTKNERSQYLHGCCFSPTKTTFIPAIKNWNFSKWPGLIENLISKMPPSPNTAKGPLNQEMANLQSTKIKEDKDFPTRSRNTKCKNKSFHGFSWKILAYWQSLHRSNRTYMLICYSYDGNTILAEHLENRSAPEIVRAWKKVNERLASAGIEPKIYILDNEISKEYKQTLQ